ncbi:hypothetical protein MTR_6g071290 [Medicago truncatula]|uniref:TTF-type domain-containing protein n=1 Tax=Medicago truncatula TaxID=3880 RepID=G7KQC1_MEDTR|nr:hypothetical protein MTR_6g071290 [Medicago truncatula]
MERTSGRMKGLVLSCSIFAALCCMHKIGSIFKKHRFLQLDLEKLQNNPCFWQKNSNYHPSDREVIRRYYLQKVLCKPKEINFPINKIWDVFHKFNSDWYSKYRGWVEYSQKEDAAYCLCCYFIRPHVREHKSSGDQHIEVAMCKQSLQDKDEYQIHLIFIVDCIRFL